MKHSFSQVLAIILTITLVAPAAFSFVPQRAHAYPAEILSDTSPTSLLDLAKNTLTSINSVTSAAATYALYIDKYVLMPLAFVMSGNLLKKITAATLAFVLGGINGTGAPQFVQNLQGHLQAVGDTQANAFLIQFSKNSNSPFSVTISSSLRANYYQQTSLGGFFTANRCTLGNYASDQNAFLAGNWSKGGIGAWFALTTQDQNNPYTLYQNSQNQLSSMVQSATAAREEMLSWGQGMLSWCGEGSTQSTISTSAIPKVQCVDNETGLETPIQTPGGTITASLNKVLGSTQDKLTQIGQLGPEVNKILGDIGTVVGSIGFAQQVLGGSSGGLSGIIQSGPGGTSILTQYKNDPGYLGVSQTSIYQNTATLGTTNDKLTMISQYETAWNSINSAASAASTTVQHLASTCATAATDPTVTMPLSSSISLETFKSRSSEQAQAAKTALTTEIAPVLAQAVTAFANSASARTMTTKVQTEMVSTDPAIQNAASADLVTLQNTSPTSSDLAQAQQEAQAFGAAVASPAGSLTVAGGSLVDQMSLIATNAQALETSVCTPEAYAVSNG